MKEYDSGIYEMMRVLTMVIVERGRRKWVVDNGESDERKKKGKK